MTWTIHNADCLEGLRQLPDNSVQTCVTSPPYWGLRDYGTATWEGGDPNCTHDAAAWASDPGDLPGMGAQNALAANAAKWAQRTRGVCSRCGAVRVDGQLGLEGTPDEYVAHLVDVFREVRRVLRPDGTLWLNLGDSYASTMNGRENGIGRRDSCNRASRAATAIDDHRQFSGLKHKDLVGIPWRVAFALQEDGWWLRSDIIWSKPNPMPESVTDRPTKSHEYLFLLAKSERYYYDADLIREPHADKTIRSFGGGRSEGRAYGAARQQDALGKVASGNWGASQERNGQSRVIDPRGRNRRSVWTIATHPFPEAHFATFPPKLVEPCILAGSSPRACQKCGAPWERVTEKAKENASGSGHAGKVPTGKGAGGTQARGERHDIRMGPTVAVTTIGWQPTCSCEGNDGSGRSIVLDPFAGAGTTLLVAERHGRDSIGFELNPDYCDITRRRLSAVQTVLDA